MGLINIHLFWKEKTSNGHLWKDNLLGDFYHDWSIKETCDTVTLESSHPLKPSKSGKTGLMIFTHECEDDQIAYFKIDVNLIDILPDNYLGNVWKTNNLNYLFYFQRSRINLQIWPAWDKVFKPVLVYLLCILLVFETIFEKNEVVICPQI